MRNKTNATYWIFIQQCVRNIGISNSVMSDSSVPENSEDSTQNEADEEIDMESYSMLIDKWSGRRKI